MLTAPTSGDLTLAVKDEVLVRASLEHTFESVLAHMGRLNETPDGKPFQMTLEPWPGGRWFRDRGNGIGHLWGHVQVIKPPVRLELSGPMFMSYPALNHLEVKLEQRPGGTHVDLRHRAIGFIDPAHRKGVSTGWKHLLDRVAEDCSKRAVGQRS